jgi:hypothetical protein
MEDAMLPARGRQGLALPLPFLGLLGAAWLAACTGPAASHTERRQYDGNGDCEGGCAQIIAAGTGTADEEDAATEAAAARSAASGLPRYLFTREDAAEIDPLVEPLRETADDQIMTALSTSRADVQRFVETFLDGALRTPALSPGRDFTVLVLKSRDVNAYADGAQNILINEGALDVIPTLALLGTLCHEAAHSTRNHYTKRLEFADSARIKPLYKAFSDDWSDYFARQYDTQTQTYTHDAAAYAHVLDLWTRYDAEASLVAKRQEAEADIVGGMLCAHLGMPVDRYIESFEQLASILDVGAATSHALTDPKELTDGEQVSLPPDELFFFLFPSDTHPSFPERLGQLRDVQSVIASHLDRNGPFFQTWMTGYALKSGWGAGAGLTDGVVDASTLAGRLAKTVATSKGRVVRIARPFGCGEGRAMP